MRRQVLLSKRQSERLRMDAETQTFHETIQKRPQRVPERPERENPPIPPPRKHHLPPLRYLQTTVLLDMR